MQGYQPFLTVGHRTGILRLRRRLTFLHKDRDGIRRLTCKIIIRPLYWSVYGPYRHTNSFTIKVELIIFPLKFGDTVLRRFARRLRSGIVQRSNTFARSGTTSGSLLRILRLMSQKMEPKASNEAFASIKAEKAIELATNEIIRQHVSKKGE